MEQSLEISMLASQKTDDFSACWEVGSSLLLGEWEDPSFLLPSLSENAPLVVEISMRASTRACRSPTRHVCVPGLPSDFAAQMLYLSNLTLMLLSVPLCDRDPGRKRQQILSSQGRLPLHSRQPPSPHA